MAVKETLCLDKYTINTEKINTSNGTLNSSGTGYSQKLNSHFNERISIYLS